MTRIIPREVPPRRSWQLEQQGLHPLLARIYAQLGVLGHGHLIEVARADIALGQRLDEARRLLRAARPYFAQYPEVFAHQLAEIDALLGQLK